MTGPSEHDILNFYFVQKSVLTERESLDLTIRNYVKAIKLLTEMKIILGKG